MPDDNEENALVEVGCAFWFNNNEQVRSPFLVGEGDRVARICCAPRTPASSLATAKPYCYGSFVCRSASGAFPVGEIHHDIFDAHGWSCAVAVRCPIQQPKPVFVNLEREVEVKAF